MAMGVPSLKATSQTYGSHFFGATLLQSLQSEVEESSNMRCRQCASTS